VLATIARHELRQLRRDGRLRAAAWLGLGLLVALALLGWQTYRRELHERAHFEASARSQWENQGEKHPHRAAHFGFYLTKPELPLALFDSGIKPATGRVLWLEAHSRTVFAYSPVEDAGATGILGLTNGAEILQLLGTLLVILAAYGSVAREKEDGTLRLILAQGVSPRRWFAGKCTGLAVALSVVGLPIAAGLWLLCWRADPAAFTADAAGRGLALVAAHALFFAAWLVGAVAVSAWARTARGALACLLGLWVAGGVLAPRLASTLASTLAPLPTIADFAKAHADDFTNGFDGEPGWSAQLAQLEKDTLARHGVKTLAELPVGFSGLRMQAMDAFTGRISDRHQRRLEAIYERQTRWHWATAALGPYVPMRALSGSLTGMDWPHYQHFAEVAEHYRRGVVKSLDQLLERELRGDKWEIQFGRDVWSKAPPFTYSMPDAGWALRRAALPLALVAAWFVLASALAWAGARRITP
jgi:ABC-2 type transport system permease protein